MSSFNRRQFLLGSLALPLAACGFSPVYGPGGGAQALQGRVAVQEPRNQNDFWLNGALERSLGVADDPAFDLSYAVSIEDASVAISSTNTITRRDLIGTATYTLRNRSTGEVVARGSVRGFAGFSNTGSTQATQTARQDANKRLMQILADQITQDLIAAAV
ncbi:LPS assembly lipoprotein LptE [Shimia ponticola]|uniref:LPS assembly lipoprotein LptE n=1 Tax=Shimia ponticola TaxID=2582893 RepID=UPI0011BFDA6A|nr:LPS assembly lipoprotein LptE [Shimia ponticola]